MDSHQWHKLNTHLNTPYHNIGISSYEAKVANDQAQARPQNGETLAGANDSMKSKSHKTGRVVAVACSALVRPRRHAVCFSAAHAKKILQIFQGVQA